jgi:hypothetical protein
MAWVASTTVGTGIPPAGPLAAGEHPEDPHDDDCLVPCGLVSGDLISVIVQGATLPTSRTPASAETADR